MNKSIGISYLWNVMKLLVIVAYKFHEQQISDMLSIYLQLIHIFVVSKSILYEFNAIFKIKTWKQFQEFVDQKTSSVANIETAKVAELKTVTVSWRRISRG